MSHCWCGSPDPVPFRPSYGRCSRCGTLVYLGEIDPKRYLEVNGDESGFYGRAYWEKRVPEVHGLPTLEQRARTDLVERAPFALQRIVPCVAPGGSVLELGCAHGGLTYLMTKAGLDAVGLELSPWLIARAEQLFGVTVHQGPLEACHFDQPFDAIVAIDVLEHLPDPLRTLQACRRSLAPGGRLFLQTPCYRDDGVDWEMFVPEEHLFLFTADSVADLLRQAGFDSLQVEPSLFSYDMWVTAGDGPIEPRSEPMAGLPPELVALCDLRAESQSLQQELADTRGDQQLKQDLIRRLDSELTEVRSDQRVKEEHIRATDAELERLDRELAETRADQAAKEGLIERISKELTDEAAKRETASVRSLSLRKDLEKERRARLAREKELESLSDSIEERIQADHERLERDLPT